jgi:hypothetical protein
MSIQALAAVIDQPMPPLAKVVIWSLADEADKDGGKAFLAMQTIADQHGIGRASVDRKLKQLEAFGFIVRQPWPEDDPKAQKISKDKRPVCWRIVIKDKACVGRWPRDEAGKLIREPKNILGKAGSDSAEQDVSDGVSQRDPALDPDGVSQRDPALDPDGVSQRDPAGSQNGVSGVSNSGERGITGDTQPFITRFINPSRARDAEGNADPEGDNSEGQTRTSDGGVSDTPEQPSTAEVEATAEPVSKEPSLAERWRKCRPVVVACFTEATTISWLDKLIPESDDGKHLALAAPSRFHADTVRVRFGERLGKLLQREVSIEHRAWCAARARDDVKS